MQFNHRISLIVSFLISVDFQMLKRSLILFTDRQQRTPGGINVRKLHNQPIIVNAWYFLITASPLVTTPLLLLTKVMLPEGLDLYLLDHTKSSSREILVVICGHYISLQYFFIFYFLFFIFLYMHLFMVLFMMFVHKP